MGKKEKRKKGKKERETAVVRLHPYLLGLQVPIHLFQPCDESMFMIQ